MFIRYNYFGCFLCCCSVPKCQILCDPMDCSMPSLPVLHCLLEFAQIQVHCVDDAILSFHPLLPSSPLALSVSQHQGLLQWIGFSLQVAKMLEPPHPSFQWIFRIDFLQNWLVWSPCCPRDSQEPSPAPQFESISFLYGPTLTSIHDYWKNHSFDYMDFGKMISLLFNMLSMFVICFSFLPRNRL